MSTDTEEARSGEEAEQDEAPADSRLVDGDGSGDGVSETRSSLTVHPYDDGTYATALAVDRALAPLDPEVLHAAVEDHQEQD
jgi:hypothetical protein